MMTPDELRKADKIGIAEICERLDAILAEIKSCELRHDPREIRIGPIKLAPDGGWEAAHERQRERAEKAEARVRELEAWQLAIAEPLGYVNRPEGQGGFRVADAATILDELKSDRAVCLCGCPDADHENYGEDGESCDVEGHECVRVCAAAGEIVARLRRAQEAMAGTTQADLAFMRIRELEQTSKEVGSLFELTLKRITAERDRARDFARRWRALAMQVSGIFSCSSSWRDERNLLAAEEDAK